MKKLFFLFILAVSLPFLSFSPASNLILVSTFEGTTPFAGWSIVNHCCSYSFTPTTLVSRAGKQSIRFELNKSDADIGGSKRSEINLKAELSPTVERWYGSSYYFPSDYFKADNPSCPESFKQWHQPGGGPPPLALWVRGSDILVNQYNIAAKKDVLTKLTSLVNNKWIDFVLHVKWSPTSSGLVEIWVNGVKVYTKTGINNYPGSVGNYLKTGIYKWGWAKGYASNTTKRVLYVDEIRIGNASATYADVAPGTTSNKIAALSTVSYDNFLFNSTSKQLELDVTGSDGNDFSIEKSTDGLNFTKIGAIKSAAISTDEIKYYFKP